MVGVGNHPRARGKGDHELTAVARDGHDQPHALRDRTDPDACHHSCAHRIERYGWSRNVGDADVEGGLRVRHLRGHPPGEGGGERGHELGVVGSQPRSPRFGHRFVRGRAFPNDAQPLDGILDVGADGQEHRRNPVAGDVTLALGAYVDGRHRHDRVARQFALRLQVRADAAGADGQHGIVDGRAVNDLAQLADHVQVEMTRADDAVGGNAAVEARARHGERLLGVARQGLRHPRQRAGGVRPDAQELEGRGEIVRPGPEQEIRVARHDVGLPGGLRWRHGLHLWCQVVQQLDEMHAGGAVDRRVMRLREHGETALGHALQVVEALDDVELPEGLRHVERPLEDARRHLVQFGPVAGFRQANAPHVVVEFEVLVLDPVRVVGVEGYWREAAAGGRPQVETLLLEAGVALFGQHIRLAGRRIVDRQAANVHRRGRRLHEDEGRVLRTQLF